MKSNSMTALTLYPFLRQIKILRSTAVGVTKGIDATGRPFMDQPRSTVARGMRLRVIGALSRLCSGVMSLSFRSWVRQESAQLDRINNVNPTRMTGCQFSSV
jgi:hypothetical protein